MNLKFRLIGGLIGFLAAGIYVSFFSGPAHKRMVAKLQSATTNQVIASLGLPYRIVEATNFTTRANQLADDGYPISNADMSARGAVWLYPDGGIRNTSVRNYQTVFFDESNRVYAVYTTYWAHDPWGSKP